MKFLIPISEKTFKKDSPDFVLNEILKFKEKVFGIYFKFDFNEKNLDLYQKLLYFLEKFSKLKKEIIIVFNPWQHAPSIEDVEKFLKISKTFEKYITCASFTNIYLAKFAKKTYPNWKIDLSTNSLVYNISQLRFWKEFVDPYSINVPRDFPRSNGNFEDFKKYGLKTKVILNECCLFGCPVLNQCYSGNNFCTKFFKTSNILKSNWISPSYFQKIKDNIDIAKICHRGISIRRIVNIIKKYDSGDDNENLFKLISNPQVNKFPKNFYIPTNKIPKKIFTCKCSECFPLGKCRSCEKFMLKCINDNFKNGRISVSERKFLIENL